MICVRNVSKAFGPTLALDDVSLDFQPARIHAVIGENGAGKSTLMHVLGGFVRPDAGAVLLDGVSQPLGDPAAMRHLGIEMVHQHFTLAPALTVAESLALARMNRLAARLDIERLAQPALAIARELGWELDPRARTGTLPVGVRQRVEIVKALAGEEGGRPGRVLVLDEPTAVLSPGEVEDLFRVIRNLRDAGRCIILIAHKLAEVLAVAEQIAVLRHGKLVAETTAASADQETLARWMVGELPPGQVKEPSRREERRLVVKDLEVRGDRGEDAVRGVSFEVFAGEIFGIGGVDGNGQVELAEALAGIRSFRGHLSVDAEEVAYIPPDRQLDGLALEMSVAENLLVRADLMPGLTWGPFLRSGTASRAVQELVREYDVRASSAGQPAGSLSGGNQQKIVVSRVLSRNPRMLVAVNPTRGLDFSATAFVHEKLLGAAASGSAVVLFSTDLDELAALCPRRVFMSGGRFAESVDAVGYVGGSPS